MRLSRSEGRDEATVLMTRTEIEAASSAVEVALRDAVLGHVPLVVVKAPPGSGKTYLLLKAVEALANAGARVAIGAQTNSQADDICDRIASEYPDTSAVRLAAGRSAAKALGANIRWITDKRELPHEGCVVVSTVAKWSLTELDDPFDILLVDEAWQMSWSDFMLCGQVSGRFVLIGDPGQIPPVVSIPVHRWETSPRAPHQPAPELILADPSLPKLELDLPACRRLPFDSVDLVRPFYDFPFGAWATAGERYVGVAASRNGDHFADLALDKLAAGSAVAVIAPTPDGGPPLELDKDIAHMAAEVAVRLLDRGAVAVHDDSGEERPVAPDDIGLVATHRVVNTEMYQALPPGLRGRVQVDTPERWQGLERKVMIVVHPLSGVTVPSSFDLETGRLCVMTSRHRSGVVVVSRDHIPATLEAHIPVAEQAIGRPDIAGRGHAANLRFWEAMEGQKRVVHA